VTFNLNSELYAAPNVAEGVDYARRHRRHELAAQAHHHPAVLDLRGGVPRRARPAPSRAGRGQARSSMS